MKNIVFLFGIALCGASFISCVGANRISSGQFAPENEFQYAISLQQFSQIQHIIRGHRCGGVLTTFQHALTAASCTFNTENGISEQIDPSDYRVFAGSVLLTNDTVLQDNVRLVANITVHPHYLVNQPLANNIAIITLTDPFSSNTIAPLALPAPDYVPALQICSVAGWGSQNLTATASTELMFIYKYVVNQNVCSSIYSALPNPFTILPTMICAATALQAPSGCTGDEGNALVCRGNLTGLLVLTNNCTASINPEVYTRISSYTTWIRNITVGPSSSEASTIQPGIAQLAMFAVVHIIIAKIIKIK